MASAAFRLDDLNKADAYAGEALSRIGDHSLDAETSNTIIYAANYVRGLVAMKRGDERMAAFYLRESAKRRQFT
jgi:hypothetical protein